VEILRAEVKTFENVVDCNCGDTVQELLDVELALVGGGNGTVIFP